MANTYYKLLNSRIATNYADNIILGLQKELTESARMRTDDIFDVKEKLKQKEEQSNSNINQLLKFYIINQILRDNELRYKDKKTEDEPLYVKTHNPNFRLDKRNNTYYRVTEKGLEKNENIVSIDKDGSYTVIESKPTSPVKTKKVFNIDDEVIKLQLINADRSVVDNKVQAAAFLNMRKEYAQKYKYPGFSGNSGNIATVVITIKNKFSSSVETGYYMDRYYHLYKWDNEENCFVRDIKLDSLNALLADYDFEDYNVVIRKEYTGTI